MKAILISPEDQELRSIEVDGLDQLKALIGYETLESDAVGDAGDRLYFDEECFIRGSSGRFQIDSVVPVAGKAVLVGSGPDDGTLSDVQTTMEELRGRIKFQ